MSLPHFFCPDQVLSCETEEEFLLRLAPDDVKHFRVLRIDAPQHIAVVDANNDYFECEVVSTGDGILVRIAQRFDAVEHSPKVTLVQGLSKGEKMDLVFRHATELGVSSFVPLACCRSVVKLDAKKAEARTARWNTICKSAAMQSGRREIPEVYRPCGIADLKPLVADATCLLVCWEEADDVDLSQAIACSLTETQTAAASAHIVVVVGPEGGLSSGEVDDLCALNPHSYRVTLGPTILRTETAGIVAPALVLFELGGLR